MDHLGTNVALRLRPRHDDNPRPGDGLRKHSLQRKPTENEKLKGEPEIAAEHTNGKRHPDDDSRPAPSPLTPPSPSAFA